jgi:hypothetical protein
MNSLDRIMELVISVIKRTAAVIGFAVSLIFILFSSPLATMTAAEYTALMIAFILMLVSINTISK